MHYWRRRAPARNAKGKAMSSASGRTTALGVQPWGGEAVGCETFGEIPRLTGPLSCSPCAICVAQAWF